MSAPATPQSKTSLIGLQADQFRHPLDLQATQALRRLPGVDLLVRGLLGSLAEEVFYLENLASSIQVGEQQLPHLHQLLIEACRILDLDVPQLYVRQNPTPNAYTLAIRGRRPFIVVHASLLDLLTPPEIQAVLAHELGHLKCDHSIYLTPMNLLILAAGQIPTIGGWIAQGVQTRLLEWLRCAEFTCDRAALLVSQDARVVVSTLMKLTGGSASLAPHLNVEAFLVQARSYDDLGQTEWGAMLKQTQVASLSHPVPVLRAREIDRWASSQTYQSLIKDGKMRYNGEADDSANHSGGWRNW